MKKIKLLLYLLLAFGGVAQAQTQSQFWSDTFEDTGAPSSGVRNPENNAGLPPEPFKSYFVRAAPVEISVEKKYTGFQGGKFWAGEDHSGIFGIGNEEQQIDFNGIDIKGKAGLTFKGLFAANSTSKAWGNTHYKNSPSAKTDYIYLEYRVDGGAYQPLLKFFGDNANNKNLAEDTGIDSIGDGKILTSAFEEFSKELTLTGTTLDIRIKVFSNAKNEEWAIDNFRLFETAPCKLTVTPATVINVACKGGADGKASVLVAGAIGAITYNWAPGNPAGDGTTSVTGLKAGKYTCTVKDGAKCSKEVEITITEPDSAISFTQTLTICAGKSVIVGKKTHTKTGRYTDVLKSLKGCDSTVITNLTVSPAVTKEQSFTLCAGKSVKVGTHTYNTTGVYTDTFKTAEGCDSIVTSKVTVLKAISTTQEVTVCKGKSFKVGTHTYSVSGTYTDTLIAKNECDSMVITKLTVSPAIQHNQVLTICKGGAVQIADHIYTKAGMYKDTLKTKEGCDSVLSTTLMVTPALKGTQAITVCSGKSVTVGTHVYKVTGSYKDTLKTKGGCDSILTTNLTVTPASKGIQAVTICAGKSLTIGTHVYTKSGTYTDSLVTKGGCDSILTTTLTVTLASKGTQAVTICAGKSLTIGTHVYTKSGIYTDSVVTKGGCDSILTTTLTVSPILSGSQKFTICEGQSVVVGTHTYTVSGTYNDTLHNDKKCDSVIVTHLEVIAAVKIAQNASICLGDVFVVGTHKYVTPGVYTDTLKTKSGCDSILTTTLTFKPLPVVTLDIHAIDTLCLNAGIVQLSGGLPVGGTYTVNGVSSKVFNPLVAGVGTHKITYSYIDSVGGCKDSASAKIYVDVCLSIKNEKALSVLYVYPNPYTDQFTVKLAVAKAGVFTITLTNVLGETVKEIEKSYLTGNYKNEIDAKELTAGIYFITVQSAEGKIIQRIIKN